MNRKNLDQARLAALEAVLSLWREGGILDEAQFSSLEPSDRARAHRLSREVLRNEAGFDRAIKAHSQQKPKPPVRAVLHLACHELLIDETAPHGVIHAWVEIAKSNFDTKKASGFINAVLRKINDDRPKLIPTNQFGKALRAHLLGQYPSSKLDAINKVQSHYPPNDLCLKSGLDAEEWAQNLEASRIGTSQTLRVSSHNQVSALPGFEDGQWWVQDVSASIAATLFTSLANKRLLDLCAAPGGKTMQLADAGAHVTAIEISPKRAKRITQNLERVGLQADVIIEDALIYDAPEFDAILLDAPCSATGTIRRHPDLRFDDPLGRMEALKALQAQLLDKAFERLKAGGELVYCTCSLLQEEGEAQTQAFLQRHNNAKICEVTNPLNDAIVPEIRILPMDLADLGGCDGFYIVKFTKLA